MAPIFKKIVVGNTEIDVAPLEVISFKLLLEDDKEEIKKLYGAAESPGFFLVDVRDSQEYITDVDQLYSATERYFTQPEEIKLKDFVEDDEFRGYKGGKNWGSLEIIRDDHAQRKVSLPTAIQPDAATVERFISHSDKISYTVIDCLSKALWPNSTVNLRDVHCSSKPSNCSLKVYRGPMLENLQDIGDNTHTDGGTLTLLYTDTWGTQIKYPESNEWAWIEAKPGHAIVNVGDALQAFSGGKLHSCKHRVSQPVAGYRDRWVVSYFFRPENDTPMAALQAL